MLRPRFAALALLLTACGGATALATATPSCRPPVSLPQPVTAAPPVSATADRAQVDPGGTVTFTETVTGPATVEVDCSQPVQLVVTDRTGLSVYGSSSAAAGASACGTLVLGAGAGESYQVVWPVDPSLPGGTYTAILSLGDAPELTLSLAVGTLPGVC
ncbi:MAG: hypothetical protein ACLQT7_04355 [Candidatus Dormibacteria bacterium]